MNYRFNGVPEMPDDTYDISQSLGQRNVEYYKGSGLEQHDIFNKGLEILSDCDVVFISDADEFITQEDQQTLVQLAEIYPAASSHVIDYLTTDTILTPRKHCPVVIIKQPNRVYDVRHVKGTAHPHDTYLHHFGYAWNGYQREWKKENCWYKNFDREYGRGCQHYTMPEEIKELIGDNSL